MNELPFVLTPDGLTECHNEMGKNLYFQKSAADQRAGSVEEAFYLISGQTLNGTESDWR